MVITLPEEAARLLPANEEEASSLVTEILISLLDDRNPAEDDRLLNRPDWQAQVRAGRKARAEGKTVSHEEVLAWHDQHR